MKRALLLLAILATLSALGVWWGTDRHAYTKFEVVERVPVEADPDDPFAGTGLYDGDGPALKTERRDEFHLGLVPTPQGLFDKHAVSVATVAVPFWLAYAVAVLLSRRKRP